MNILTPIKRLRVLLIYKVLGLTTKGVRVIIKNGNKVLLIKHPYDNYWVFPGGGIEKGETEIEAAKREALEETSYDLIGEIAVLGKYQNNTGGKDDYVTICVCDDYKKSDKPKRLIDRIEVQKQDWFDVDNLPNISRATKDRLKELHNNDFSDSIRKW